MKMKVCFGIDIGGTTIKFGMFDGAGLLLKKWERKTPVGDGKILLETISRNIMEKVEQGEIVLSDIIGLGIGIPGAVKTDGHVEASVNLDIRDLSVSKDLSELLGGLRVFTGNDANIAALGEMWQGGGKGYKSLVLITLGTGVGSGIVIDGKVVNGKRGMAGEIGHIMVNPDEPETCNCGRQGCLDQIASATGLVTNMNRIIESTKSVENSTWQEKEEITAKDILDAARFGDPLALATVEYCMEFLGQTIATIGLIMDPEAFIIGGGVSNAGEFLLEIIARYSEKHSVLSRERADIVLAQLGNDAGIYGAAKLVLDNHSAN